MYVYQFAFVHHELTFRIFSSLDPTMLVAAPDMTSSMTNVAMDIGQEVIYQVLYPAILLDPIDTS